jgi:hypothetical protein
VHTGTEASAPRISQTAPIDDSAHRDATPSGFRHFLGTPQASQRFKAYGIDPLAAPAHLPKVRGLMNRLSRRMDAELPWPAHRDATIERWENPHIPSGYTYLLQFVAHDLVHSAIPLSVAGAFGAGTTNARRTALKLETLFGSGPVGSPFVYALDAPNDERRTKLRLGRMRWDEKGVEAGCPFRDIARTQAENVTGIDRSIAGHRVALTEALVADPRNDDHAIMSQLTALFALLHNGLVDIIRRGEPATGINANLGAAYNRFLCARDALTSIYHNVIRKDLMRRAMHPAIYAAYAVAAPNFIDRPAQPESGSAIRGLQQRDGWQIPLEFSHGAFRFGHAMVRPEYIINDLSTHDLNNTLEKTSANDPVNMPLDTTWIVRWSRFFEIQGSRPNFSRRIGPYLSDGLGNDRFFPAVDQTNRVGLLYRDLLGSALAGLWSVDALIAEIAARRPQLIGVSRLLADRSYRVGELRAWLASSSYGGLSAEDIETLANDPPLPFFILFEAMQQPHAEGLHLGPLGSIIVSEVIFGALVNNELAGGASSASLTEALAEISAEYYPTNVFEDVPEIERMDQLVEFTAEIGGLREAVPAFL